MTIALERRRETIRTEDGRAAASWHIITGEYPPDCGGVGDYTRLLACGLAAAGDPVTVWTPASTSPPVADRGVSLRRLPDQYGPSGLRLLSRELAAAEAPRVLVQYVPHAFGARGVNLPFCVWLWLRRRDRPWVMFHEVAFPFERGAPFRHQALAAAQRAMAWLVGRAAARAFISIPAWRADVETMAGGGAPVEWLPVPSTVAVIDDARAAREVRERYAGSRPLVGSFGTFGGQIRALLHACVPLAADRFDGAFLLLGQNSEVLARELIERQPRLAGRVHAAGTLGAEELSVHIRACDLMLQPYPDGVSTRRTSAMAALAHDRALVTTSGPLTEDVWAREEAAVLVPSGDAAALAAATAALAVDPERRAALAGRALQLYRRRFDLALTIDRLRRAA